MPASVRGLKLVREKQLLDEQAPVVVISVVSHDVEVVGVDAVLDVDVGRIERVSRVDRVVPVTQAGGTRAGAEDDDADSPLMLDTSVVLRGAAELVL